MRYSLKSFPTLEMGQAALAIKFKPFLWPTRSEPLSPLFSLVDMFSFRHYQGHAQVPSDLSPKLSFLEEPFLISQLK